MSDNPTQNQPEQPIAPPQEGTMVEVSSETSSKRLSHVEQDIQANKKIQSNKKLVLELGTLFCLVLVIVNIALIVFSKSQVAQYHVNLQQIAAAEYNSSDLENTVSFLETKRQQTQVISDALPKEDDLITFIQTLEVLSLENAGSSKLEITASAPRGEKGLMFIPFMLTMTTDLPNLLEFLKKVEKLSYLVEVVEINATPIGEDNVVWSFELASRVYVSNQFK